MLLLAAACCPDSLNCLELSCCAAASGCCSQHPLSSGVEIAEQHGICGCAVMPRKLVRSLPSASTPAPAQKATWLAHVLQAAAVMLQLPRLPADPTAAGSHEALYRWPPFMPAASSAATACRHHSFSDGSVLCSSTWCCNPCLVMLQLLLAGIVAAVAVLLLLALSMALLA